MCTCVVHADEEAMLLNKLLSDYNKLTRPVDKRNESVEVVVDLVIVKLVDVDVKHKVVKADTIFRQVWHDKRLSWNASHHNGVDNLFITPEKIWLPNIILANTYDGKVSPPLPPLVKVHANGTVISTSIGSLQSHCYLDLENFPFDHQTCAFRFISHLYTCKEVTLTLGKQFETDRGILHVNYEWNIVKRSAKMASTFFVTPDKQCAVFFIIEMERKYHYYLMMIVVPSTVISFLSLCSFCLPPECGERLSLGFTLLVALSVYQLLVGDMLPSNSKVPAALGTFILCNMLVVSSAIVWSILMINLKKTAMVGCRPPPSIVKVLHSKSSLFCRREQKTTDGCLEMNLESLSHMYDNTVEVGDGETMMDSTLKNSQISSVSQTGKQMKTSGSMVNMITQHEHKPSQDQKKYDEEFYWNFLLKIIDRTLLFLNLIGFVTILLYYIILPAVGYKS
ncbi:neuronal acetylcholine receptor subunit beta-3-like [Glandiceps talaboti]